MSKSGYSKNGKDLTELYAAWREGMTTSNSFTLKDYNYNHTPELNTRFLKVLSNSPWCNMEAEEDSHFSYGNNIPLPFADELSATLPIREDNTYFPYKITKEFSVGTHYIRYNSDLRQCEWSDDRITWNFLIKASGVFLALQGGGGGGGGGNVDSEGAAAQDQGGGGGGAGGFILMYLNLNYSPNQSYKIIVGSGGECGIGTNWGIEEERSYGHTGGDTQLFNPTESQIASAFGGKGGTCGHTWNAPGGSGGSYSYSSTSINESELLSACTGYSGGSAQGQSGYWLGIPAGNAPGNKGGSFGMSQRIDIKYCPSLGSNIWDGSRGEGGDSDTNGGNAYSAGGGGAGAAVCSKKTGSFSFIGYGYGGNGGWMDAQVYPSGPPIHGQTNGGNGVALILTAE